MGGQTKRTDGLDLFFSYTSNNYQCGRQRSKVQTLLLHRYITRDRWSKHA